MTSAMRHYMLPEQRTQFYTVVGSGSILMWTLNDGFSSSSLMTITGFKDAFSSASGSFAAYTLFKYLGRQNTVYNYTIVGSPHVAIFRQVQEVSGANTEGITTAPTALKLPFYLCVWADTSPTSLNGFQLEQVARVG